MVLVIGNDWRGVHGKGKTVEAPSTTTDDGQEDLHDHREGPEAGGPAPPPPPARTAVPGP